MFGFIRPVKSELRVREADRFQQVYCGLCHAIRARYGRFYTLFLSYDMTFFVLVAGAEREGTPPPCRKRCDAHPLLKRPCAAPDDALALAADVSVLLSYHKFRDSLADEKGAKRLLAWLLCGLGKRGYQRARARLPDADREIVAALDDLQAIEREKCPSMDRAADASARMTAAVVPRTGDARERVLRQMFYHIGRWVYLLDAAQDVAEDLEQGNYNPVVLRYDPVSYTHLSRRVPVRRYGWDRRAPPSLSCRSVHARPQGTVRAAGYGHPARARRPYHGRAADGGRHGQPVGRAAAAGFPTGRAGAVSYTHLDVYKRQSPTSMTNTCASLPRRRAACPAW